MEISTLDSEVLDRKLRDLLGDERQVLVAFLLHLAEFDRRRGHEALGHPSLWDYCTRELRLLECATYRRIHAARLLARFPEAADCLRDGRLAMTTLVLLEKVLTEENAHDMFVRAAGKTKKEVEYLVACASAPVPSPREMIRKLPDPPRVTQVVPARPEPAASPTPAEAGSEPPPLVLRSPASRPPVEIQPIGEDRFVVRMVVDRSFLEALEKARSVSSHVHPDGAVAAVLRRGLDAILEKNAKRHGPARSAPRTAPAPAPPAERIPGKRVGIPAATVRQVWQRDRGRCVWPLASGGTCGSTWQLEIDHILPVAKGGGPDVRNCRVLCKRHNLQHARAELGEAFMRRKASRENPGDRPPPR